MAIFHLAPSIALEPRSPLLRAWRERGLGARHGLPAAARRRRWSRRWEQVARYLAALLFALATD